MTGKNNAATSKTTLSKEIFLLTAILAFGLYLYVYKLATLPPGFYIDEVFPGYNAYSLLTTGRDEYGKFLPIALRFFGIYNPPLFTYALIPSIHLLGLTKLAVRLPAAFFGLMTTVPVYLLIRDSGLVKSKVISLITAFLFLITPWNLLFARTGFEVSLGLMLFAWGAVFLQRSLNTIDSLKWAFIFLSLSTYAAYAERLLVPLVIVSYLVCFWHELNKYKKAVVSSLGVLFVLQLPNIWLAFTPAFFPKGDLFFGNLSNQSDKILYLPHNISFALTFVSELIAKYTAYFSPKNLFYLPDPDLQRSMPELSVLYGWMIIPYCAGLYTLWAKSNSKQAKFLKMLLIVSPIPAALTKDPFATHRVIPLLLSVIVVIGIGMETLSNIIRPSVFKISFGIICICSLILLWRSYFVLMPVERYNAWDYGVDALAKVASESNQEIVIDQSRGKPLYMHFAFFDKFLPNIMQQMHKDVLVNYYGFVGPSPINELDNVEFRPIKWGSDDYTSKLLVGDSLTFSDQQVKEHFLTKAFSIKGPDGEIIFVGYLTNPTAKCASDSDNINCIDEK